MTDFSKRIKKKGGKTVPNNQQNISLIQISRMKRPTFPLIRAIIAQINNIVPKHPELDEDFLFSIIFYFFIYTDTLPRYVQEKSFVLFPDLLNIIPIQINIIDIPIYIVFGILLNAQHTATIENINPAITNNIAAIFMAFCFDYYYSYIYFPSNVKYL